MKKIAGISLFLQIFFIVSYLKADIIITEIMPNAADENRDEFVEIYNNGTAAVNLTGWKIEDSASADTLQPWTSGGTMVLPAKKYAVILDDGYLGATYVIPAGTILLTAGATIGNGLSNTADEVKIKNSANIIVSSCSYSGTTESKSIERVGDTWQTCYALVGNTIGAKSSIPQATLNYFYDGIASDISKQTSTMTYSANWSFSNATTYYFALSSQTSLGTADLTNTTIFSSVTLTGLALTLNTTYYFYIQAENQDGEKSSIAKSNGVFIAEEIPIPKILINELMPYDENDEDWIEFYVLESGNLKGFKLKSGSSIIKTFGDVSVKAGDYFILNFDKNLPDAWPNFYTTNVGLTSTDGSLILSTADGKYVDAVFYANADGTWAEANKTNFDLMVSTAQWIADESSEAECFVWKQTSSKSISRKYFQAGAPIDSNRNNDFELGEPTKGFAKKVILDDFSEDCDLKFLNKHFSPYGDYKYQTLQIKYKNKANTILKIKIYDIQAHFIKTLLLLEEEDLGIVEWNGKDENGNIMPVGVYLIYSEFVDKKRGKIKQNKKAVVLGRML